MSDYPGYGGNFPKPPAPAFPGVPPSQYSGAPLAAPAPSTYSQGYNVPPQQSPVSGYPPHGNSGYQQYPAASGSTMMSQSTMPPAPKSNVQFFSFSGGTPTPQSAAGPPSSIADGAPMSMPPPPSTNFGYMPPPPSSTAGVVYSPSGMIGPPPPPPSGAAPGAAFYPGPPGSTPLSGASIGTDYAGQKYGAPSQSMAGLPAAFQSSSNFATIPGAPGGGMNNTGPFGMPLNDSNQLQDPSVSGSNNPLPLLSETDLTIQCDPAFMRTTVGKLHQSQNTANTCRIPLGVICKPMAGDIGVNNDKIDVVDFGTTGIVRCKRCRTYINPFVSWADNGRRWRCNICGMLNDVPNTYFSHLDSNGHRRDKEQRPELSRCSVEFVAPGDYMVRPPQPPVYFFVVDVSSSAVQSGMIHSCVAAIKDSLDEMPGMPRTQIGFITFDTSIHFYNLKSSFSAPQMLVVSDVSDSLLPLPEDLLVNLQESRAVVNALLDTLPSMFAHTTCINSCTGPALMAAKRVIQHVGGKVCLFQATLPSVGEGALKPRDNPRLLGTDKEHMLLNAEEPWYKNNAIDLSRLQITVDTFLFSAQYTDLASISVLSKHTAGQTYYYPNFQGSRDGIKFESELRRCLTRATGFEAVMRVRATRGIRITNFYGNYFIRGTDLLALPNCHSDTTFALDLAYEESVLNAQVITVQAALLYTSSAGERRIRVHTLVLPVTMSVPDLVDSVDIDCVVNILTKQAIDIAQKTGLENARQRVNAATIDMIKGTKMLLAQAALPAGPQGYGGGYPQSMGAPYTQPAAAAVADVPVPLSLQLLPLYSMSVQKSLVLRGGTEVRIDERAYYQQLVQNMDLEQSKVFVYPRMFSIHDMTPDAGLPSDSGQGDEADDSPTAGPFRVRLPAILNLSHERLSSDGIYLLENGVECLLWVGRAVSPSLLEKLFGVSSLEGIPSGALSIQVDNGDFSGRAQAIITALRQERAPHMQLHVIREGDGHAEAYFARYLVEDRALFQGGAMSYNEYHGYITRQVSGLPS